MNLMLSFLIRVTDAELSFDLANSFILFFIGDCLIKLLNFWVLMQFVEAVETVARSSLYEPLSSWFLTTGEPHGRALYENVFLILFGAFCSNFTVCKS